MPVIAIEGSALLYHRKRKKLTLVELSDLSGVKHASISKYELNHQNPGEENLNKLADALGIAPEELMMTAAKKMHLARQVYLHRQADKILEDEGNLDVTTPEQTSKLFEQMVEVDPNEESEISENEERFLKSAASPGAPVSDLIKGEVVTGD